jgi:putative FmdB family regulatory protein
MLQWLIRITPLAKILDSNPRVGDLYKIDRTIFEYDLWQQFIIVFIQTKWRSFMPTYEFHCDKCKKNFSIVISISDYEKKKFSCPACKGKKLTQRISSFQTVTSKKS